MTTARVWLTHPAAGIARDVLLGLLAFSIAVGAAAADPAVMLATLAVLWAAGSFATSTFIGPRPACRPGRRSPSRSAVAHAAPRHRGRAVRWAARPHPHAVYLPAPQTGRPRSGGAAALKLPAAATPPVLPAAAGSPPAPAEPGSPSIRYRPGRAAVGGAR